MGSWSGALLALISAVAADDWDRMRGLAKKRSGTAEVVELRELLEEYVPSDADERSVHALLAVEEALEKRGRDLEDALGKQIERSGGDRSVLDSVRRTQDSVRDWLEGIEDADRALQVLDWALEDGRNSALSARLRFARALAPQLELIPEAAIREKLSSRKAEERLVALQVLASGKEAPAAFRDSLIATLQDEEPSVRLLAVHALGRTPEDALFEPIVECMRLGPPFVVRDAVTVLEDWSGQSFGASPDVWHKWRDDGGTLRAGAREIRFADDAPSSAGVDEREDSEFEGDTYYGIPQDGKAIVYVLDISDSMGSWWGPPPKDGSPQITRIRRAVLELQRSLRQLTQDKTFNIVVYAQTVKVFSKEMEPAAPRVIERACKWIEEQRTAVWTHTYGALQRVFQLAGRSADDRLYDAGVVDTVFLLTDGVPTLPGLGSGSTTDVADRIHRAVERWNPLRRISIHTIGFGAIDGGSFLEEVAARNHGNCVLVKPMHSR